jgi:hypothetical protein
MAGKAVSLPLRVVVVDGHVVGGKKSSQDPEQLEAQARAPDVAPVSGLRVAVGAVRAVMDEVSVVRQRSSLELGASVDDGDMQITSDEMLFDLEVPGTEVRIDSRGFYLLRTRGEAGASTRSRHTSRGGTCREPPSRRRAPDAHRRRMDTSGGLFARRRRRRPPPMLRRAAVRVSRRCVQRRAHRCQARRVPQRDVGPVAPARPAPTSHTPREAPPVTTSAACARERRGDRRRYTGAHAPPRVLPRRAQHGRTSVSSEVEKPRFSIMDRWS